MLDLAVSVVLYRTPAPDLQNLLKSLASYSLDLEIIFLDHSPEPMNADVVSGRSNLRYFHNSSNPGFGVGHNSAIGEFIGKARYHLVLNPDVSFEPSILEIMVRYMDSYPQVGLLSPKIYYEDGRIQKLCKLLPTPFNVFSRRFLSFSPWVRKHNEAYELSHFDYDSIMEVPNLSGCFMLIRMEALEKCGWFDPRYFMYFEDIDLVRRINDHYRVLFFPTVSVVHAYGKASYKSLRMLGIHIRSACAYFNKWGWFRDRTRASRNRACLAIISDKNA